MHLLLCKCGVKKVIAMNEKLENSICEFVDIVKTKFEKKSNQSKKDSWDHAKVIAQWIAAIAIPIVLALASHWVTLSIKTNEAGTKMVELAVEILGNEPKNTVEDKSIRQWALNVIEEYSGVEIPEGAKTGFKTSAFPISQFGAIVGNDDREIVNSTNKKPWNSISQIEVKGESGNFFGTGFLIHPRIVISANFVVEESEPNDVFIHIGRNGKHFPFPPINPIKIISRPDYKSPLNFAFLILPKELSLPIPSLSFKNVDDIDIMNSEIHFAGYPGDMNNRMTTSSGKAIKVTSDRIFHDIDTGAGSSGGPLWITKNQKHIVIGLHLSRGHAGSIGKEAVRIYQRHLDMILHDMDK